ncbi:hypothetical protein ES703_52608 [subsurface metagenome]
MFTGTNQYQWHDKTAIFSRSYCLTIPAFLFFGVPLAKFHHHSGNSTISSVNNPTCRGFFFPLNLHIGFQAKNLTRVAFERTIIVQRAGSCQIMLYVEDLFPGNVVYRPVKPTVHDGNIFAYVIRFGTRRTRLKQVRKLCIFRGIWHIGEVKP